MKKSQRSVRHLIEGGFIFVLALIQSVGLFTIIRYPEDTLVAIILILNLLTACYALWLLLSQTNKKQLLILGTIIAFSQVAYLSYFLFTRADFYISSTSIAATFFAVNGFSLLSWLDLANLFRRNYTKTSK